MKHLKLLSLVLFTVLSISLYSCGNDDDEGGGGNGTGYTLIGEWQCTWTQGYERYANIPIKNKEWNNADDFTASFNENGTLVIGPESGKWKLVGDELTMTYIGEDSSQDDELVFTVLKLTDSELIIEAHEQFNGYEYYIKNTFRRK